ncbi:MAG: V-type ATP synthase subunit K, partial [Oscillospiraceae bacterium]|nr:V-type ATP synthase subunit K [Oscillospiraceae bacterium]
MEAVTQPGFLETFGGPALAILGGGLAAMLCCIGSARGTGIVGEASAGLTAEQPEMASKCMVYQIIPGTQGLYGFLMWAFVLFHMGVFGGSFNPAAITVTVGLQYFVVCLPIMIGGMFSAIYQGRVAVACINIVAKKPDDAMKGMTMCIIVEFYAILS